MAAPSSNALDGDTNVFLFVPNLIGYARIVFALAACYWMPTDYIRTAIFYVTSVAFDAVDGYAARMLNQSSRLGAMLDQLTDRLTTLSLMMCLCYFYPEYMFAWQLAAIIDIGSHWLHMHSHDLAGSTSHKNVDETTNPVLRLYYKSRPFLFFMCFGNEMFFSLVYLCYFSHGPRILGIGLYKILAGLFFPVAFVKSLISLVHLVQAAQRVVDFDTRLRASAIKQD